MRDTSFPCYDYIRGLFNSTTAGAALVDRYPKNRTSPLDNDSTRNLPQLMAVEETAFRILGPLVPFARSLEFFLSLSLILFLSLSLPLDTLPLPAIAQYSLFRIKLKPTYLTSPVFFARLFTRASRFLFPSLTMYLGYRLAFRTTLIHVCVCVCVHIIYYIRARKYMYNRTAIRP